MAQTARLRRRIAGILSARLPDLQLDQVPDTRSARGKRWQLTTLLTTVLAGMLAGCTSLLGVEQLTEFMTRAARRLLGIARRLPDTTMRTAICALAPEAIRPVIHRQILAAHRRKSLTLDALPIGVAAIDGKSTAIPSCDDLYAQRQTAQGGGLVGVVRRLYLTAQMAGYHWEHLQTVVRIESQTFDHDRCVEHENRYYVCSLPADSLSPDHWLLLIRRYWGVENGPHFTLDVALQEDDHPWIEADPKGAVVLVLLRRVAYNLLTLFRSVTLRGELSRMTPWKKVLSWFQLTLLTAIESDLAGLRARIPGCAAASSSQPVLG